MLGSLNMDLVVRAVRLPGTGETIPGGPFETHPGGKGANQAVAAARMGAEVAMIGRVGDDEHGRRMSEALRAEGIDVSRIAPANAPTGVALITVADDGENTIVVAGGANAVLTPEDVDAARGSIAGADVLLMQLESPLEAVVRAAALARDAGTTVILNAAPAGPLPMDLVTSVDVLVVNESEAAILAGRGDADTLVRLRNTGVHSVILTLGARGAAYAHGPERGEAAGFHVEAVDTVGAGDAFTGALAARWAGHQIGAQQTAAGAIACTRPGAIPSLPTRAEVLDLLRREGRPAIGDHAR